MGTTFKASQLFPEVIMIDPKLHGDHRGFLMETYKESEFKENSIPGQFVQDNHSRSAFGVLRGLHYQKNPKAQGKLMRVIAGELFQVSVDIRHGSPTYGKWLGTVLSAENRRMLYLPPGFANGFLSLTDGTEMVYKLTAEFAPEAEVGICWDDPLIGIEWPMEPSFLSDRDRNHTSLERVENNFVYQQAR